MSSNFLFVFSLISLREFLFPSSSSYTYVGNPIILTKLHWKSFFFPSPGLVFSMITSSCSMTTGFWCYHVAFYVVGWILALAPTHLILQLVPALSLPLGPILEVVVFVFATCSWPTLCFREPCHWGLSLHSLLTCSFGLHFWVTLLVQSVQSQLVLQGPCLGPPCEAASCVLMFLWSCKWLGGRMGRFGVEWDL